MVGLRGISSSWRGESGINREGWNLAAGDEQHERLKHQVMFLRDRELVSVEMERSNRQLWLLEGLAGTNPAKLDPHLHARLQDELANATLMRLKETGLFDEWQRSWDLRAAGGVSVSPEQEAESDSIPRATIHRVPR